MSLVGTLAKVAIGVAIAKGVSAMSQQSTASSAGTGGLFGGASSPKPAGGGLEDMMGSILGGGSGAKTGESAAGGGLGDLLGWRAKVRRPAMIALSAICSTPRSTTRANPMSPPRPTRTLSPG